MKLVAIVASLAFLEGCSFIVRPDHNRTAPIVDTLVAAGAGLWCLSAVGQGDGGRGIYPPMIICVPLVPIALIEGISAGYGFHRVSAHSPGGARAHGAGCASSGWPPRRSRPGTSGVERVVGRRKRRDDAALLSDGGELEARIERC